MIRRDTWGPRRRSGSCSRASAVIRAHTRCHVAGMGGRCARGAQVAERLDALAHAESPSAAPTPPPLHEARYRGLLGDQITFSPRFQFRRRSTSQRARSKSSMTNRRYRLTFAAGWPARSRRVPLQCWRSSSTANPPASVSARGRRRSPPRPASRPRRSSAASATPLWPLPGRVRSAQVDTPFYSTSLTNHASLANARKLGLIECGSRWSVERASA